VAKSILWGGSVIPHHFEPFIRDVSKIFACARMHLRRFEDFCLAQRSLMTPMPAISPYHCCIEDAAKKVMASGAPVGMVPQDGVRLFPRRKAQDNGKSPQQERSSTTRNGRAPMVLSLDAIAPLFDLPQAQAAQRLGVALTSLKVVCRKLGVDRW
jgi:hypothetical protein